MLLCTVVVYVLAQSFLFGHIRSHFLKNKVILSSFLSHKNGPSNQRWAFNGNHYRTQVFLL